MSALVVLGCTDSERLLDVSGVGIDHREEAAYAVDVLLDGQFYGWRVGVTDGVGAAAAESVVLVRSGRPVVVVAAALAFGDDKCFAVNSNGLGFAYCVWLSHCSSIARKAA